MSKYPPEMFEQHSEALGRVLDGCRPVLLSAATGVALGVLIAAGPVNGAELEAREPHACAPSLEAWERTHGRKTSGDPINVGEIIRLTWDSGARVEIMLLPARDPETGNPALCAVMSRYLGRE